MMDDLIQNLMFEYYSIQAANPDWDESLWDFLIDRGISEDDIWAYAPGAGEAADKPAPDWL